MSLKWGLGEHGLLNKKETAQCLSGVARGFSVVVVGGMGLAKDNEAQR